MSIVERRGRIAFVWVLVAELRHLAPRIAAHLLAAAQDRPAESAADAWLDLAMTCAQR